ncbi:hypothetical protein Drose_06050 [Dactylosporangium roseum]|uniref:Uncharacterized protein n=1 Tax=Dactylosporangium roseum TaxID=47989 RepID=A0ABY5Z864_9ACTN|nr:hypothetical protein [Dactylosporangium roseum]UWZ37834.1 hypothetical protein Drose_06050 [Dactylosporangium roseum]
MELVTFEALLKERVEATGQVEVRTFMELSVPFLYGLVIKVDGGAVAFRLTKGSGTGDPPATGEEQAAHDANVARLDPKATMPRLQHTPERVQKASGLIRDVLAADLPAGAVGVEGRADGRELPGVKVVFKTGSEIYVVPVG